MSRSWLLTLVVVLVLILGGAAVADLDDPLSIVLSVLLLAAGVVFVGILSRSTDESVEARRHVR